MDELVRSLLEDLAHNLDRLADQLERDQPALARTLRFEARHTAPARAEDAATRRSPLRPVLYDALDEGALGARDFDRLMVLEARARRVRRWGT
jgi:hypothetical protein